MRLPKDAEAVVRQMAQRGFAAGLPLASMGAGEAGALLIAVTEKRTREELDQYAQALQEVCDAVDF